MNERKTVVMKVFFAGQLAQEWSVWNDQIENMKRIIEENNLSWTMRNPQRNTITYEIVE